jgi:polyphosphate kinase
MGSADMMRRNLLNRVEVVFPVIDQRVQQDVLRILATNLQDNQNTWILLSNGLYQRVSPAPGEPAINSQALFMENPYGAGDLADSV